MQKSFSPYIFIHFSENCHTADRFRHSVKKEDKNMKNKTVKALALLMTVTTVSMMGASSIYASDTETTWELWGFKDRAV